MYFEKILFFILITSLAEQKAVWNAIVFLTSYSEHTVPLHCTLDDSLHVCWEILLRSIHIHLMQTIILIQVLAWVSFVKWFHWKGPESWISFCIEVGEIEWFTFPSWQTWYPGSAYFCFSTPILVLLAVVTSCACQMDHTWQSD